MGPGDLKFYCNKIINNWIIKLVLMALQLVFYILFVLGLVVGGLLFLAVAKGIFSYKVFGPFLCILVCICIGTFVLLIQFDLRVLLDLKEFVDKEAICLISYNSMKTITSELEDLCRFIIKNPFDNISELSHRVNNFKKLKMNKEYR